MKSYTRVSDGSAASAAEAVDERGCVRPGFALNFSLHLMDSAHRATPSMLRDAAGKPARLIDALTGVPVQLTDALIAGITSEAARLGTTVDRYISEHLRYSTGA